MRISPYLFAALLLPALLRAQTPAAAPAAAFPERAAIVGLTGASAEQPIGGAEIEVHLYAQQLATWDFWRGAPTPPSLVTRGRSDAQGRFGIEVPLGPLYDVRFRKGELGGRVLVSAGRPFLGPLQKDWPAVEDPLPKHELGQPCLLARFRDRETGELVPGVRVRQPWGTQYLGQSGELGEGAEDGLVRVASVPKVEEDLLMAFAPGYQILGIPKEHIAAPNEDGSRTPAERSYELVRSPKLHGRIVDAQGKPQQGIVVLCETDVLVDKESVYGAVAWWTRTDADGRYVLSGVAPGGRYWVRSLLNAWVPTELGRGRLLENAPEGASLDVDLGTLRTGPRFSVAGRVTLQGKALAREGRVHVLRLDSAKIHQKLVTRNTPSYPIDPSGIYRIPALVPGSYELCFWVDGLEHEVRVVRAPMMGDSVRLDVDMGPGRTISGKVVDKDGKPVGGVLLRALVWRDEYQVLVPFGDLSHNGRFLVGNVRVLTREDGSFKLERVRSRVPILLLALPEGRPKVEMRIDPGVPGDGSARNVTVRLE
jgi:hypothetical protein